MVQKVRYLNGSPIHMTLPFEYHTVRYSYESGIQVFCICSVATLPVTCFISSTLRRWDKTAAIQELFSFLRIGSKQYSDGYYRSQSSRQIHFPDMTSQISERWRHKCILFSPLKCDSQIGIPTIIQTWIFTLITHMIKKCFFCWNNSICVNC